MIRLLAFCFALLLGCACTTHAYAQVFAGLTADFEDNTTQGFGVGPVGAGATSVVFDVNGGSVLQNQSVGGAGALSAQLIQNQTTFAGDYISTGITGISATVAVDPASDGPLFLRLGFTDNAMGGGTGFSSADALVVQNDGEFVDLFFPINATDLVIVPGTGTASFEEVLSNVDRLRILSAESGPAYIVSGEDRLASVLLIDNIVAVGPSVLLGDVNLDQEVDFLDISPFISFLSSGEFLAEADIDQSGEVDFLDISGFISILANSRS